MTFGDIENKDKSNDKMNCAVTLKLCDWKIIEGLKMVEGSEGLQQYLKLLTMLHQACVLDESKVTLKNRLYNLIYVASFCRRWKQFLLENGGKPGNFITLNAWTCIEINLVFFVRLLRRGYGHMIYLCTSQMCEEMFRTIRSFGTWGFTQINFSMNTGLNLLSKVNLLLDVMNQLSKSGMKFGEKFADQTLSSNHSPFIPQYLHEFEEREIVNEATEEAKKDASGFGIDSEECDISAILKHGDELNLLLSQVEIRNPTVELYKNFKKKVVDGEHVLQFKNLQFVDEPQENFRKIVRLTGPSTTELISKQQFLRLIEMESNEKVSKDRGRRFIAPDLVRSDDSEEMLTDILVKSSVAIGDWIVMKNDVYEYDIGMIFKFRDFNEKQEPSICRTDKVSVQQLSVKFQLAPIYHLETSSLKLKLFKSASYYAMEEYECTVNKNMLNLRELCMNPQFEQYLE